MIFVYVCDCFCCFFFFSSRRRHTRSYGDWSSDVCSSDLMNAIVDFPVKPEARPYLDAFEGRVADTAPLAQHRRRGLTRFAETGFPSRKSESWRYLDLQRLARDPLLPAGAPSARVLRAMGDHLTGLLLPGRGPRLVLVDGHFAAEFSSLEMPEGVW